MTAIMRGNWRVTTQDAVSSSLLKNLEIEALLSSEGPGFW